MVGSSSDLGALHAWRQMNLGQQLSLHDSLANHLLTMISSDQGEILDKEISLI